MSDTNDLNLNNEKDYSINLKDILNFLYRNKFFLFGFSLLSIVLGLIRFNSLDKVWKGEFKIVVADKNQSSFGSISNNNDDKGANFIIPGLVKQKDGGIKNDIVIIKGPSVLMPIYEFVKEEKKKLGQDLSSWKFTDWEKSVNVELTPGTTVLQVSYLDRDKEIISDVLRRISTAYQNYSIRGLNSSLKKTEDYLTQQIDIYKKKAADSQAEFINYGRINDLSLLKGAKGFALGNDVITNSEYIRARTLVEINQAEIFLDIFNKSTDNFENIKSMLTANKTFVSDQLDSLLSEYDGIKTKEAYYKTLYQKDDLTLRNLQNKKARIEKIIKNDIRASLNSYLKNRKKLFDSNNKPENLINRYKELFKEAMRDEATLNQLTTEMRAISLQRAKSPTPWEVITQPYTYDYPVAPRKLNIIPPYFFVFLLVSLLFSFLIEKKKDLVFSEDNLLRNIKLKKLASFEINNYENWDENIKILFNGILSDKKYKKISFTLLGEFPEEVVSTFSKKINYFAQDKEVIIETKFSSNKDSDLNILISFLGMIKTKEIIAFEEKVFLSGKNFLGIILFKNQKNFIF